MAAVIRSGELYTSKTPLEYALGESLIAKAGFTLSQIDELLRMFVHDHVRPVARKLGYEVKESKGPTILDYYTASGYAFFKRKILLTKEKNRFLVIVKPEYVEIAYLIGEGGFDFERSRHVNLDDPTFFLMEFITEHEKKMNIQ